MPLQESPIVIGGTGGSGTRVLVPICRQLGCYLGDTKSLNESNDAMEFYEFLEKWVNVFLSDPCHALESRMREEFRECVARHLRSAPRPLRQWGWKNPRTMLILPFIDASFPHMRFIHMIRDGRDMANSANQNQPMKHGVALLGAQAGRYTATTLSIEFWQRANTLAADYGESKMGNRYLRIRYEDLCNRSLSTLKVLADFLGSDNINLDPVCKIIERPDSIGRWREYPRSERERLTRIGRAALQRFGYSDVEVLQPGGSCDSR